MQALRLSLLGCAAGEHQAIVGLQLVEPIK